MDQLFIDNNLTVENTWIPTGDESMPSGGPAFHNVDHGSQTEFMEPFNTTTNSYPNDRVEEVARKRKWKNVIEKTPPRSKNIAKGEISQCIESFKEVINH